MAANSSVGIAEVGAILKVIAERRFEPLTLTELSKAADTSPANMTRWTDGMIEQGWMRKTPDKFYVLTDFLYQYGLYHLKVLRDQTAANIRRQQQLLDANNPFEKGETHAETIE